MRNFTPTAETFAREPRCINTQFVNLIKVSAAAGNTARYAEDRKWVSSIF